MTKKSKAEISTQSDSQAASCDEIPTSRFERQEFDVLDEYLGDDFNHAIFLSEREIWDEFGTSTAEAHTLEFLQEFYRTLSFVKENLDRPLQVEKKVMAHGIDLAQWLVSYGNYVDCPTLSNSRAMAHLEYLIANSNKKMREATEKLFDAYNFRSDTESVNQNNDDYDPSKRGLTRQLAMMLLDELFPNLTDASNKAKAEFLQLLTGFDADGLRTKWSDYRRGNPKSLEEDLETVRNWKKKLRIKDLQK